MAAELLDLFEYVGDAERILADHAALQEQRVGGAGAVADLAESVDALVGIEPDDGAGAGPGLRTVAMRRSVIFSVDGLELVLTF